MCSIGALRYFTSYTAPIQSGPSPFTPLYGEVLVLRDHKPELFLADTEPTSNLDGETEVETFSSFAIDTPMESITKLGTFLAEQLKGLPPSTVGVEIEQLPADLLERLRKEAPGQEFRNVSHLFNLICNIKDEEEIEIIRLCCALWHLGQDLAKKLVRPGITGLELFEEVRRSVEEREGEGLPVMSYMISGVRTSQVGGLPSQRLIKSGGPVICDVITPHHGYWGESCNTCIAGEPNGEQEKFVVGISTALSEAIAMVRPGLQASKLSSIARKRVLGLGREYPHHTGHGVGLTWHEEPRIVPYNHSPLQSGVVIALEPRIYFESQWGMRLENVIRVTETGSEILSKFKHSL